MSFKCADALESGLAEGTFDAAWLIESSQYLGPPLGLMRESARLLAPGGRLALCDAVLRRPLTLSNLRRWHDEVDILRDVFDAVMASPEQYCQPPVEAGFEVIREIDLTERVLPTFGCWRERARGARERGIALIGEAGSATLSPAAM